MRRLRRSLRDEKDKRMDIGFATIVLAVATGSVPIVAWGLNQLTEILKHQPIPESRKEALCRVWKGYYQITGDVGGVVSSTPPIEIDVAFTSTGRKLVGKGHYNYKKNKTIILMEGYLKNDRILVLDYKNADLAKFHFGSMMLSLNADVDKLSGYLLAYGRKPDGIIVGYIELNIT